MKNKHLKHKKPTGTRTVPESGIYVVTDEALSDVLEQSTSDNGDIDVDNFFSELLLQHVKADDIKTNDALDEELWQTFKDIFGIVDPTKETPATKESPDKNDHDSQPAILSHYDLADEALEYLESLGFEWDDIETMQELFYDKFPEDCLSDAVVYLKEIRPFAAGGNIFEDSDGIDDATLFVMRWLAGLKMQQALEILKFDLNDSNIKQDLQEGNIGTAQRWAKTVTGSHLEDDEEMMCGRYTSPPRLATFPNNHTKGVPITKICSISSVCSHHMLAYGTMFDNNAYAVISYIPKDFVLGISKLQRLVNHISKRPTIQEDLTTNIWKAISKAAQTEDVYVGIFNAKHTCELLRGSKTHHGAFTTEWYDGAFNDDSLRMSVLKTTER